MRAIPICEMLGMWVHVTSVDINFIKEIKFNSVSACAFSTPHCRDVEIFRLG